ncbi:Ig-like domain-containing protein [Telmatospirillum sp.]|uniref:Ig-like domain-containing protein n=1 Tax=Telmatospirillum sp. TaxID=2079197 RepID=UPI00284594FB|nr:Ig-like domain-containing protein [Telmatospirillum sp.]MDR3437640.1 Ig-like domain-containing protein [Telmatospirillum sp.]
MTISDGSATAPAGTAQDPTLLASYGANRPAWEVAGVDYYVGCPQGLALKDPSTISMAGVTLNTSTHTIYVTANNVTLNGYDFSLEGGWSVVTSATNTTIENSNFVVGANSTQTPIFGTMTSGNVTVTNCTIDGAGNANVGQLILMEGSGTLTVDHSWLKNAGGDMIDMNNSGPSALVAEYNLIQNAGMAPGAHGDFTQFLGAGPYTATIQYNTTSEASGLSSQGFMVEPDIGSTKGVITGGEIGHNTMLGYNNVFTGVTVADLTGKFVVDNNYIDPTGTTGGLAFGGGRGGPNDSSANSQYINNVNMVNGSIVQDSNAATEAAALTTGATTTTTTTTTTTSSTPPAAPAISSWSPDTGVVGDGITDASTLTLHGTAVAGSTVKVYDGSTLIGTVTADSTGAWTDTTPALTNATHVLTATDTVSSVTSAASASLSVTVDTVAPAAPVETSDSIVNTDHVLLSGTAEANSTITVYDGTTAIGTGTTNSSGGWSVTTSSLSTGSHNLTATATDVAGNVSALSAPLDPVIGSTSIATSSTVSTGTPQDPTLLASYGANRPAWEVAGVDYYVGCPQGLALKDPSTISMAGVTVNASTHTITVTGNNVTLNGYDFSLAGGWNVVTSANNTTIENSKFVVGANSTQTPIYGTLTSGNLTVENCTIDGGMNTHVGALILASGAGTVTVQSCWLKNAGCDMIDMNNDGASNLVAEYNFFQNGGAAGQHGDFVQFLGAGPYTATILYNTTTEASGLSSQGFMVEPDLGSTKGVITGGEIGYNTMVGYNNVFTGVTVADLTGKFTVDHNYIDPTGTSGGLAFGGLRGGPNDSSANSAYIANVNMVNGSTVQDSNASSEASTLTLASATTSSTPTTTTTTTSTTPAAPAISSWSPDTGVVGDGITNANHLTIKGTAVAGSTVKVYDGSTLIGTVTADSTGAWTDTTPTLTDGKHVLTTTDTVSGVASAASASLSVTVDTVAPAAPVETSESVVNTNHVLLSGTAEANSTITVYEGTTAVGTGTTNASGSWSVTTSALSTGSHALTATATDVAGNVSALSAPLDPVIGTTPPAAPTIATFSTDSGVVGDHITNDHTPTLTGTAVANTTVQVFDGGTLVGTGTANSSGQWSVTTSVLADGSNSLTATDTNSSGQTSAASADFTIGVDTLAPYAPSVSVVSQAGASVGTSTSLHDLILEGTAEGNSTVTVYDGSTEIGAVKADSSGAWSLDTGHLTSGSHSFTATATDIAGNIGVASAADTLSVTAQSATSPTSSTIGFTHLTEHSNHVVSIQGVADADSVVELFDGTTQIGTATASSTGAWHFSTAPLSNAVHVITAEEVTHSGAAVATSSGEAIIGSTGSNVLASTPGDDYFLGNGHPDTFVFATNFGHDVIGDFVATGGGHDTIQFGSNEFSSFASVLSHASQVGLDVVIASGSDTLTLKNTKMSALNSSDFHFA